MNPQLIMQDTSFDPAAGTFTVTAWAYDFDAAEKPYQLDGSGNPVMNPATGQATPLDPLPSPPVTVTGTYPVGTTPDAVIASLRPKAKAGFDALLAAELAAVRDAYRDRWIPVVQPE